MKELLLAGAIAGLLLASCDNESNGEPQGTPNASPSATIAATPTLPASFPVELAGIEFQGEPTTGPEWCDHADEVITGADLSSLADTPWQMFGDGLPAGVTAMSDSSIQRCDGREWIVAAQFVIDGPPHGASVGRILRPEPWTQQDSVATPRDLKVVALSEQEVVLGYSTPRGTTFAWYRTPVDGGWIVTRLEFNNNLPEDRVLEVVAGFIEQDP